MRNKSVIVEAKDIGLAIELIELGARLQLLEAETNLSRERLLKLYKEVRHESPPKGMLPFSTDWFMTWQPNIHASLFMAYYRFPKSHTQLTGLELIIKSYRMYLDQVKRGGMETVLSLTRAWTMVRFFDANMLQMLPAANAAVNSSPTPTTRRAAMCVGYATCRRAPARRAGLPRLRPAQRAPPPELRAREVVPWAGGASAGFIFFILSALGAQFRA